MIGLIGTSFNQGEGASGPFVLMVILLVFTAIYHIGLNSALTPLMKYLPKTLETEERQSLLVAEDDVQAAASYGITEARAIESVEEAKAAVNVTVESTNTDGRKPGIIARFFKPHIYEDYPAMRRIVPTIATPPDIIDEDLVRDAYLPPAVWAELPQLLIPRDEMGISAQECAETSKVIPCSDALATLDEKNNIVVDNEAMRRIWFAEKQQKIMAY